MVCAVRGRESHIYFKTRIYRFTRKTPPPVWVFMPNHYQRVNDKIINSIHSYWNFNPFNRERLQCNCCTYLRSRQMQKHSRNPCTILYGILHNLFDEYPNVAFVLVQYQISTQTGNLIMIAFLEFDLKNSIQNM